MHSSSIATLFSLFGSKTGKLHELGLTLTESTVDPTSVHEPKCHRMKGEAKILKTKVNAELGIKGTATQSVWNTAIKLNYLSTRNQSICLRHSLKAFYKLSYATSNLITSHRFLKSLKYTREKLIKSSWGWHSCLKLLYRFSDSVIVIGQKNMRLKSKSK